MSAARFAYALLAFAALPYALWRLIQRGARADKKGTVRWREYFGFCPLPPRDERPLVWVHAVSVGEAAAATGMVRELRKHCRLMLTHTTAAGGAHWRRQHCGESESESVTVSACPLDVPFAAGFFFRRCRPALGIVMEAEYWPNLIASARAAGCKLLLANARMGAKSARRYGKVAPLMRECIGAFDSVVAQHSRDARRLRFFGARDVCAGGNIKFDRKRDEAAAAIGRQWRETIARKSPVLLIAGSREGEEAPLLAALENTGAREMFAVIWAPRHPPRAAALARMLQKRGIGCARRSEGKTPADDNADNNADNNTDANTNADANANAKIKIFLADTLGEMDAFYACCDVAIVCGSFAEYGGQNPIEAMQNGVPAVIGPFAENYKDLVRDAKKQGALAQEKTAEAAMQKAVALAKNAAARKTMSEAAAAFHKQNQGAQETTLKKARALLP